MRTAFAHDAVLTMEPDADVRAPGASVTVALCGHWQHDPPCPLAPHHTAADRDGSEVRLRILFATEPPLEAEVRARIDGALAAGELLGPDGAGTHWILLTSGPSDVGVDERSHAARLAHS